MPSEGTSEVLLESYHKAQRISAFEIVSIVKYEVLSLEGSKYKVYGLLEGQVIA